MGFQPMNYATTTLHPYADQSRNPAPLKPVTPCSLHGFFGNEPL